MAWPETALTIEVCLELGADLTADPTTYTFATDITAYTFDRDGNSSIVIHRGRDDEMTQAQPSWCTLTLNNRDGRFTSRNPTGAYYPNLTYNTPIRVRVDTGSGLTTRFVGFVSEWPPRWDVSEADHYVQLRADGILRRLSQGQSPLKSALYRAYAAAATTPLQWWPCEDGALATVLASGVGGPSLTVAGDPILGASGITGAAGGIDFTSGGTATTTLTRAVSSNHTVAVVGVWASGETGTVVQCEADTTYAIATSSGVVNATIVDSGGSTTTITGAAVDDGQPHHVVYTLHDNGVSVVNTLYVDGVQVATQNVLTVMTHTPSRVTLNPGSAAYGATVDHLTLYDSLVTTDFSSAATGYVGEISGTRFARLCTEEGITSAVSPGSTEAMGPQGTKSLMDLLRECEAAEEGTIVERVDGRLGFDPHADRENKAVGLTLNYASGHVQPPLEPTDDDQRTRNDITVTRTGGSSARAVDADSVAKVGRIDEGVELNLYDDTQPYNHAGWRLNLGTVDGLRFPTVTCNLRRNSSLDASWLTISINDRIKITNLPDIISYDDVDLVVEGYTEQISQFNWVVTLNCAPYLPYGVFALANDISDAGDFIGRLDADASTLNFSVTSAATTFTVAPQGARWTTVADDFDPDIPVMIDGEAVAVSNIVDAATFVSVGTAAHGNNASVTPGLPAGMQAGDLILLFAAIRNSGTGTVDLPGTYTNILQSGNMRLMAREHSGSESAPTVTFSGGVANADTSAQMCAFRGMATSVANLGQVGFNDILNGSAQNIAFPTLDVEAAATDDYVEVLVAWKQDDWTSVAPPTGFTEIAEPSTTTGDDQGIYWAYRIVTLHAIEPAGTITVTGGASAISRSALIAMAGCQTFTVTRSVNGVVKAHDAGAVLQIDHPRVLAL